MWNNKETKKSPRDMTRAELLKYIDDLRRRVSSVAAKVSRKHDIVFNKMFKSLTSEVGFYRHCWNYAKKVIDPENDNTQYSYKDMSEVAHHLREISKIREKIVNKRLTAMKNGYDQKVDQKQNLALEALMSLMNENNIDYDMWGELL